MQHNEKEHLADVTGIVKEIHQLAGKGHWENAMTKLESLRSRPDFKDILNSYSTNGYGLIHSATLRGEDGVVRRLLDLGADVNLQTDSSVLSLKKTEYSGVTALHFAAMQVRPDFGLPVMQVLIEHGANPNIKSELGRTPMTVGFYNGYPTQERVDQMSQMIKNHQNQTQSQSQSQSDMISKDQEVVVDHIKATIEKLKDDLLKYTSPNQRADIKKEIFEQEKHLEELRNFRNRVQEDYNKIQQAHSPREKEAATKKYQASLHEYGALLHRERDQIVVVGFIKQSIELLSKTKEQVQEKENVRAAQLAMHEKSLESLRTLRGQVESAYKAIPQRNNPGYNQAVMSYRQALHNYDNTLATLRKGIEARSAQVSPTRTNPTTTVAANKTEFTKTHQERHGFFGKSISKSESDKAEKLCKEIHKDIEKHQKSYPEGNSSKKAQASLSKIQHKMEKLDGFDKRGKLSKEASQSISQVKVDFGTVKQGPSHYQPLSQVVNKRQ